MNALESDELKRYFNNRSVNADGLPLFKSCGLHLWPILGLIKDPPSCTVGPFVIGVFAGSCKPSTVSEYLQEFISEVTRLEQDGVVIGNQRTAISIHSFVCDAPARALLKNVKSHTGYHGCERCTQAGKHYLGRMTFPEVSAPLRCDEAFVAMEDADHHLNHRLSPLAQISIGLVTGFPLDYMHLVCLGVVRRLLQQWLRGNVPVKLSAGAVGKLDNSLNELRSFIPVEFSRKPRPVSEMDRWKATEFRQFLLYTGPLVLNHILPKQLFQHFLLLHVAVSILVSSTYCQVLNDFAHKLLAKFVTYGCTLYGHEFAVYNVHSLIHLADDAKRYGQLDNVSCFPFENYLGQIKKLVRSPSLPLQQVVNRVSEMQSGMPMTQSDDKTVYPVVKGVLKNAPSDENHECVCYSRVKTSKFSLSNKKSDNCVKLKDGNIGCIQYVMQQSDKTILLVVRVFSNLCSYYSYPLVSESIGILLARNLTRVHHKYLLADVDYKCVCLPAGNDSFLILPMHSPF